MERQRVGGGNGGIAAITDELFIVVYNILQAYQIGQGKWDMEAEFISGLG